MGEGLGLVRNLGHGGVPELVRDPALERDLVSEGALGPFRDPDLALVDGAVEPLDPGFEVLSERDGDRYPVTIPELVSDRRARLSPPLDLRGEDAWNTIDGLARRPTGFRPGAFRGRGGGILSRSGARSAALDDAGGLSGVHRLLNRNRALELELQRVKGMFPAPLDVSPGCGELGNLQQNVLLRAKGGTQTVRGNAAEEIIQGSAGAEIAASPADDGREFEIDFLPPTAGVGLDAFISAALSARKGSSKGARSGDRFSGPKMVARPGPAVDSGDPFPPLPRSSADVVELEGDSASSRNSHDAAPASLQGASDTTGLKQVEGGENKFTWSDLLRSSKPDNICVDLHYIEPTIIDGEACAVFTLEEEAKNLLQWQNTLLCYVVGKSPSYYQFLKAMQRQWNPDGELEMFSRENGIFFCKFGSENDLKKVIKEGPWYLDGKLVVVKKFTGETNCEDDMLSSIPIWVKLPCLPVQWWSTEGVSKVVSPLGHPLYFDLPSASKSRIAYARCCVEVAMDKNLPSSVLCVGGDKVKKRQAISYDWVPKRCSACKEFGHVVDECGGFKPRHQHEVKGGWSNNKKVGKEQQAYVPKAKKHINEADDKLVPNSLKARDIAGKEKHTMMDGAIYKTNLLNKRMETIKATSANSFQLLVGLEDDDTGDKVEGDNKRNHKYFCSDDEVDDVVDHDPRNETQMQNIAEAEEITNVEEVAISAEPLGSDPAIKMVDAEIIAVASADDDPRELEARGSGKESEKELPMGFNQDNQGSESDKENQNSESEAEEEDSIRSYGKHPAECGMPPTLTVSNPKYRGEINMPKENEKKKKRCVPAPERPAGSRTTRHSFRVG